MMNKFTFLSAKRENSEVRCLRNIENFLLPHIALKIENFLLPRIAHFDNVITLPLLVAEIFGSMFAVFFSTV